MLQQTVSRPGMKSRTRFLGVEDGLLAPQGKRFYAIAWWGGVLCSACRCPADINCTLLLRIQRHREQYCTRRLVRCVDAIKNNFSKKKTVFSGHHWPRVPIPALLLFCSRRTKRDLLTHSLVKSSFSGCLATQHSAVIRRHT